MSADAALSAPPSSNAVVAAAGRVKAAGGALLASAKPWAEMADRASFSKPNDLAEVGKREGEEVKGGGRGRARFARRLRRCRAARRGPAAGGFGAPPEARLFVSADAFRRRSAGKRRGGRRTRRTVRARRGPAHPPPPPCSL